MSPPRKRGSRASGTAVALDSRFRGNDNVNCGKSTLLRIVSGLDFPSAGEVFIDDTAVRAPRPEIGVVFQSRG